MIEHKEEYELKLHRIFELEITGEQNTKEYETLLYEVKFFEDNDLLTSKEMEDINNG